MWFDRPVKIYYARAVNETTMKWYPGKLISCKNQFFFMNTVLLADTFRNSEMTDGPVKGAQNNVNIEESKNVSENGTCHHPETTDLKILPGT